MAINVIDMLQPSPSGRHPIVDARHTKGGYYSVPSTTDRDLIPIERRSSGMVVHIYNTNTEYRLISGITNDYWTVVNRHSFNQVVNSIGDNGFLKSFEHQLGYFPNIHITSASGVLIGEIIHTSNNSLKVRCLLGDVPLGTGYLS